MGVCTAYVVATGAEDPWYVDVDDAYVYWTSHTVDGLGSGRVERTTKEGRGPIETVAELGDSFDLAIRGSSVYVTTASARGLRRIDLSDKKVTAIGMGVVDGLSGGSYDLTGTATTLFYTVRRDFPLTDKIVAVTVDGGNAREFVSLSASAEPEGIGVDGAFVYWANQMANTVGRVRQDGREQESGWHQVDRPRRIRLDEDALYTTTPAGVSRRSKSGDVEALPILAADVHRGSIVVDDRWLYVAIENEGVVARIDKRDGSGRVDVGSALDHPIGVAQDATAIYFTERAGKRIWRAVK